MDWWTSEKAKSTPVIMATDRPPTPIPESPKKLVCERPEFMEPCPSCGATDKHKTHKELGFSKICAGCVDPICTGCLFGARYFCPLRLPPPTKLERSTAVGVQSPKAQETVTNK